MTLPWDRQRIVDQLLRETNLPNEAANVIAKAVENHVIEGDFNTVSTTLIRELVNNELADLGYTEQLRDLSLYAVPRDYVLRTR